METTVFPILVISGWISIILVLAISLRRKWPDQKELSRKIVHIGTGPVIPLAWWLQVPKEIALIFAIIITIGLFINYFSGFLTAIEDIHRTSYGTIAYGLSITIMLYLFWPNNAAACSAGVMVMAFGDGFAGLLGSRLKSPNWKVFGQKKSLIGTLIMGLISLMLLIIINTYCNYPLDLKQIVFISLLAVSFEQIGNWGLDNLSVPIGVSVSWYLLSSN